MLVMPCFCSTSTTSSQQSAMVMEAVSTGDLGAEVDSLFSGVVCSVVLVVLLGSDCSFTGVEGWVEEVSV